MVPVIPGRAWIMLFALTFFWGSMWPLLKIAAYEIPLITLRGGSALLAATILMLIALVTGRRLLPGTGEIRRIGLCAIFLVFCWFYLSALGVSLLPAGRTALLAYTMPFFALVIGVVFLKEKVTGARLFGVAAGIAAVLVLTWNDLQAISRHGFPIGALAVLGGALVWSIGSTLQKEFRFQTPVSVLTAWMLILGGVPLLSVGLMLEPQTWVNSVSAEALIAAACTAVLSQGLGFWCWSTMLKLTDIAFCSIAILIVPLASLMLSFILLGEKLGMTEFFGLGLITIGLATVLPLGGLKSVLFR